MVLPGYMTRDYAGSRSDESNLTVQERPSDRAGHEMCGARAVCKLRGATEPDLAITPALRCRRMDLSVLPRLRRKALMLLRQDWIPISLTDAANRRIFDVNCRVRGHRMRSNPKPAVGDMRKRITRRCVSAATGACC